jgi:DNA primase small subunit
MPTILEIKKEMDAQWEKNPSLSSQEKWDQLTNQINWKEKEKKKAQLGYATRDIILQYSYPRLDSNVSIGLNHLLKSPFCVHPKTGRVCVPIDPNRCDEFDPFGVPTLTSLINELDSYEKESGSSDAPEKRVSGEFLTFRIILSRF